VSARKSLDDKGGMQPLQGGLSAVRREMLFGIRTEDEEPWEDLEFCDGEVSHCFGVIAGVELTILTDGRVRKGLRSYVLKVCRTTRM
jgi:DNA-directed RNA polymerase-3 subunit RPC5